MPSFGNKAGSRDGTHDPDHWRGRLGDYMWEVAGNEAMKNTFWASYSIADPALQKFFADYKALSGTECKEFMNAVMAYDSVYWVKDAIERAKSNRSC